MEKSLSDGFRVTNGMHQGGVLSPYLFCIYVDKLSNELNNQNVGCFVGSRKVRGNYVFKFIIRTQESDNELIQQILMIDAMFNSFIRLP